MKKTFIAAVLVAASTAAVAHPGLNVTSGAVNNPYVVDGRNHIVTASDLCVRTGYWSPAAAATVMADGKPVGCACDSSLVPKEKCEPPVMAQAAPAPTPAPAPIPAPAPMAAPKMITVSSEALFDTDKSVLKAAGAAALEKDVTSKLGANADVKSVSVAGHADRRGSATYNQALSERRAAAVKNFIISKGIAADKVQAVGYGESKPLPGTECAGKMSKKALSECLAPNRRVEVTVDGSIPQ